MGLRSRRIAEETARKEAEERKHPLLKIGADRNVRDACFHAVVFAALANDSDQPSISQKERKRLLALAQALLFAESNLDECVARWRAVIDGGSENELIADCLMQFKDVRIVESFLSEFDQVWGCGSTDEDELSDWHEDFLSKWLNADVVVELEYRRREAEEVEAKHREAIRKAAEEAKRKAAEEEEKRREAVRKAAAEAEARRRENEKRLEAEKLHEIQDDAIYQHGWGKSIEGWELERIKDRLKSIDLEKLDFKSEIERAIACCCLGDYPSYGKPGEEASKDFRGVLSMACLLCLKNQCPDYYAIQSLVQFLHLSYQYNIRQRLKEFSKKYLGVSIS